MANLLTPPISGGIVNGAAVTAADMGAGWSLTGGAAGNALWSNARPDLAPWTLKVTAQRQFVFTNASVRCTVLAFRSAVIPSGNQIISQFLAAGNVSQGRLEVRGVGGGNEGFLQLLSAAGSVVATSLENLCNDRGWLISHTINVLSGTQTVKVHRNINSKLVQIMTGAAGTAALVSWRGVMVSPAPTWGAYITPPLIYDSEKFLTQSATDVIGFATDAKVKVSATVTGGTATRLSIVSAGFAPDAASVPVPANGRVTLSASRVPLSASRSVAWTIDVQDPDTGWQVAAEGSTPTRLAPGMPGVDVTMIKGCQANGTPQSTGAPAGFDPYDAVAARYSVREIIDNGDWNYYNLISPPVGAAMGSYTDADVDVHWNGTTSRVTDFTPGWANTLASKSNRRQGDDHDGGDGGNGRNPASHEAWVEAQKRYWPSDVDYGDGRPTGCNLQYWIVGRVLHILPDSRSSQRLAPDFSNPSGPGKTDPNAWLGSWQMGKIQALLADPRFETGELVAVDLHFTSVIVPAFTGEQLAGKPDAGSSYPAAMAALKSWVMACKAPLVESDQGDWHGSIGISPTGGKAHPLGRGMLVGLNGFGRSGLGQNIDSVAEQGPGGGGVDPSQFDDAYPPIGQEITSGYQVICGINIWDDTGSTVTCTKILYDAVNDRERFSYSESAATLPPPIPAERGLWIDGVPFATQASRVENRDATWTIAGRRGENRAVPGRIGRIYNDTKPHDQGTLTLSVWYEGVDPDTGQPTGLTNQVRENLSRLVRMVAAGGLREIVRVEGDLRVRCYGEVVRVTPIRSAMGGGVGLARVDLEFVCPDPYWEDIDEIEQTIPFTGGGAEGNVQTLLFDAFAGGEAIIDDAVVTLAHRIPGPIRISDNNGSGYLRYTQSMGNVAILEIDSDQFTVRRTSDDTDQTAYIEWYGVGALLSLTPRQGDGAVAVRINAASSDIGGNSSVTVRGRRKYPIA